MAKIIKKANLAPAVYEFIVDAPLVAHKCHPGQFVIIRTDEYSERIPLTIADFDRENGYITLIVQAVGNTTKHLCDTFEEGDDLGAVVGVALAVDVAQVRLDGGLADKERVLDVLEAMAGHPEGEDVGLALGESVAGSELGDGVFS